VGESPTSPTNKEIFMSISIGQLGQLGQLGQFTVTNNCPMCGTLHCHHMAQQQMGMGNFQEYYNQLMSISQSGSISVASNSGITVNESIDKRLLLLLG
jgi:uncharacterized ferredoxin-like protein